jgi:uncharacterized protein (TIGR02452 family)
MVETSTTATQWLAMENAPLKLEQTGNYTSRRYTSETTEKTFSKGTILILTQRGYIKVDSGVAVLTEQGKKQIKAKKKLEKRKKLKDIFQDTILKTEEHERYSITVLHDFLDIIPITHRTLLTPGVVNIGNTDTVTAAAALSKLGKTCILNMASEKKAGGGVANGEMAQEECLFRCSNLWETVIQSFYPLAKNEALYTTDALFFKDRNYNPMEPVVVDVITIAAINLNKDAYYDEENDCWIDVISEKPKDYDELTKRKIRLMFSLAINHGVENLVLGAWGCGVFKNNPKEMAQMFKDVLEEGYVNSFKQVYFAIINDSNSNGNNYQSFEDALAN